MSFVYQKAFTSVRLQNNLCDFHNTHQQIHKDNSKIGFMKFYEFNTYAFDI